MGKRSLSRDEAAVIVARMVRKLKAVKKGIDARLGAQQSRLDDVARRLDAMEGDHPPVATASPAAHDPGSCVHCKELAEIRATMEARFRVLNHCLAAISINRERLDRFAAAQESR